MSDQLQLRHWQQIKQAQALEYAGTPEGSAALAESKRYGLAADRIDELAAQVEATNALMSELLDQLGEREDGRGNAPGHGHEIPGIWDSDNGALAGKPCAWCATWAHAKAVRDAPNTAAILRQRDADLIARTIALMGTSFDGTIEDFQNELERKNG